ncbi:FAD-binding oxidoreductase [Aquincola sp. J276]|uniref:NAD(P)/FAD-dependent oxidoreductase n=1 Tax=Aquincola sp. J276 TaxID=2898432 RepID=UPI0021506E01|nr:FAD-binding oxidoreductase [Aquincola sp. J276]MCR5866345.1 FAD-binding oxidoreductase [Aquincola sp. J276]
MQAPIVIVGGGVMGAATACFLARDQGLSAIVIERDPLHAQASSALSASSIRQQFSTPLNIALSQWSIAFLRRLGDELAVPGEPAPQIGLTEAGYLYLASPAGAAAMRAHQALQARAGAQVQLLQPHELEQRFPWLSTEGIALGALGLRGEGWFDGPALHQAFRRKAMACGVRFLQAEAVGFEHDGAGRVQAVRCADGLRIGATHGVLLSAGAWSAPLAAQLGVVLPVSGKKRDVFVLDCPAAPLAGCPLVIDPSGFWFRPEGRGFIAGAPPRGEDADFLPLHQIDHAQFDEQLWPLMAARVPAFEALRVRSAWAGYYEMNAFDHNGLAGALPGWRNVFTACGFSGHGMQHAPAVGSAMAALMAGGRSDAPSLEVLSPQRLLDGRRVVEHNVI